MLKEFLSQKGITYKNRDVSTDPTAAQELMKMGQRGVPVTIIDGQMIIGFDRGRLEQALASFQHRSTFGVAIADASKITAREGAAATFGAYVGRVRPGSAAERMGLMPGDIITEINMQRIINASDLENVLSRMAPGSRISLIFLRNNQNMKAEGTL